MGCDSFGPFLLTLPPCTLLAGHPLNYFAPTQSNWGLNLGEIKLSEKSGKDGTRTPLFGHITNEDSKNRGKKKYTGLQRGMKLSLTANLVLNQVCLVLAFPELLHPITAAALCTVAINVLDASCI